jgi:beta-N-acetylglucosaminidase-like protein
LEARVVTRRGTKALLAAALTGLAVAGAPAPAASTDASGAGFAVRMVKLVGDPADPGARAHVRFCRKLGFNALWVYGPQAGDWTKDRAPGGPVLHPDFVRLARWCRRHGMDLWISVNPVADTSERFVFTDPEGERRLLAFVALLHKDAGVRRVVLSFDDQPTVLSDLSDIFRYGASSAPAHLDLARRLASGLPPGVALWLCASAYCDTHLGDGSGPYGKAFLEGLPSISPAIGIVWTGPKVLSPTITRADIDATRARLGGRPILLYDNGLVNDYDEGDALGMNLAPPRGRAPGIRDAVAAYLACPLVPLAGSRLSLAASAEFLRSPWDYDPDAAVGRAIRRLAGSDRTAATALETQQIEWGRPIGADRSGVRDVMTAEIAGRSLHDPALVDSFTWTAERYPGRMAALRHLADTAFRDDLLRIMRRRLAVARAMPLTIEYLARARAGRPDAAEALARVDAERRSWDGDPDARRVLEIFLNAAAVPPPGAMR